MSMPDRPDLLICDVGDTLIRWTHYDRQAGLAALEPLCDVPGRMDVPALIRRGEELDADVEERAAGSLIEYREADFLRMLHGERGITLLCDDDHLEWLYWRAALSFEAEEGVADALSAIRSMGIRLAIVSNTPFGPAAIAGELERNGLMEFFREPLLTSARFLLRKPHPAILQAAVGLHAPEGGSAWYIGNSLYHDVGGAHAAGLPVIWYNNDGEALDLQAAGGHAPDLEISRWRDLPGRLADLSARR